MLTAARCRTVSNYNFTFTPRTDGIPTTEIHEHPQPAQALKQSQMMPSLVCPPRTHIFRLTSLPIRPTVPLRRWRPHPNCRIAHPLQRPPNMQIAARRLLGSNWETDSASFLDPRVVYSANAPSRSPPTRCGTRRERSSLTSVSLPACPHLRTFFPQPMLKWFPRSISRPSRKYRWSPSMSRPSRLNRRPYDLR